MTDRRLIAVVAAVFSLVVFGTDAAIGATAQRDLSAYAGPAQSFTVTINLEIPIGTFVAAVEDQPPPDWLVTNISDGGSWDTLTGKVKWGPFFDPSIPNAIAYDVTPPAGPTDDGCFAGNVTIDTLSEPIEGDQCTPQPVPAATASAPAPAILIMLLPAGILIARRTRTRNL